MAVRHGYGKVAGTDALVFAYDTGDTVNSYKGEPTTNHIDGGSDRANAISAVWYFGNHAGADSSQVGVGEYYSRTRPNILRVKSTNGVGYGMINQRSSIVHTIGTTYTYSFDYKQIAYGGTFVPSLNVYGDGYKQPDSANYYANLVTRILDLEDGWKRFEATYEATYAGQNTYRTNMQTGDTTNFEILFDNFQIETKTHATSFTSGTRSATEGLLDLTGNKTIDLSGVSFDTSAMVDFDGTDDFLVIPNVDLRPGFTLETICYPESGTFAVWGQGPTIANRGLHIIATTGGRGFVYGMYGNDCDYQHFPTTNAWHHWVFTYDGTTFQKKFFADGVAQTPSGNAVQNEWIEAAGDLRLGTNYGSGTTYSKANGKIAVAKYYNRPLTDDEILSNFNHYKTRFGI